MFTCHLIFKLMVLFSLLMVSQLQALQWIQKYSKDVLSTDTLIG